MGKASRKKKARPLSMAQRFAAERARLHSNKPHWEGTYSFDRAWDGAEAQLMEAPPVAYTRDGTDVMSGCDVVALTALKVLMRAHPIFIGTEQFNALPDEIDDIRGFVEQVRLPFDYCYFDFSSVRGPATFPVSYAGVRLADGTFVEAPGLDPTTGETEAIGDIEVPAYEGQALLAGALMGMLDGIDSMDGSGYRSSQDVYSKGAVAATGFTVIPFGTSFLDAGGVERAPDRGDGEPMDGHAPLGLYTMMEIDEADVVAGNMGMLGTRYGVDDGAGERPCMMYRFPARDLFDGVPGTVIVGSARELVQRAKEDQGMIKAGGVPLDQDVDIESRWEDRLAYQSAKMVMKQTIASLRALYLLLAQNVEVGEADVNRQARRRAERAGGGIAQVVRVRRTKVGNRKASDDPSKRNYTHRFERRGHFHHVRRGRAANPDHMTACFRKDVKTGELTCPDGCRKIWHPPTWVGDDDLPMVPKTRIWPGQDAA